jgi:hypothetical protein
MLADILKKMAICTIFWSPDFKNWKEAVDAKYPSIDCITNYRIFKGSSEQEVTPLNLWKIKYVYFVILCLLKFILE